jgi:hypothetical protein
VIKPQQGIQPGRVCHPRRLRVQQRVGQRQAGIRRVTRRTAVAPRETQRRRPAR